MKFRSNILKVMNNYLNAKQEPIKDHALARFIRRDLQQALIELDIIDTSRYEIKASPGLNRWADSPWISIFNKDITKSMQRGYYVCYLFKDDMTKLYLTLTQGTDENTEDNILKNREIMRSIAPKSKKLKINDNIFLGNGLRPRNYAKATSAYIEYSNENFPDEQELKKDLRFMIKYYEKCIERIEKNKESSSDKNYQNNTMKNNIDIGDHIYRYIINKGFIFSKELIINFYLSLRTKPFVILSGISGTGKTMIGKWFAESLGANERNGQLSLIPVRPDWNDGSDLLGYIDIKGDFQEGPLTNVLKRAIANPERPYFVILDEMNLARVEYYFSDLLSVMENRRWENGKIVSSVLLSGEVAGEEIFIPENFYVIGTVNMDETTHPFSKKVLDRANTIEFNDVNLRNLSFLQDLEEVESKKVEQEVLSTQYLHLKDLYKEKPDLVAKISDELTTINQYLEKMQAHVGYRVRDEICFYLAHSEDVGYFNQDQALDYCILQKILPRISGSDSRVYELLKNLYQHFTGKAYDETLDDYTRDLETAKYPQSAKKVLEMLGRLEDDGFTSFWIT